MSLRCRCFFSLKTRAITRLGLCFTQPLNPAKEPNVYFFFDCRGKAKEGSFGGELAFAKLIDKTLCSKRFEVAMLDEIDFEYQARDSSTDDFYGTKVGHQILEFTPPGIAESRGRVKHRPSLVMARVLKLKKHRQRSDIVKREITYSFQKTSELVFVAHLKGSYWGKIPPPDQKEKDMEEHYSNQRVVLNEEHAIRCVYDFQTPTQVKDLINKYQAGTFAR